MTDQRGFARTIAGTVDIGAVEMRESLVVTTLNDEDDGTTDPAAAGGEGTSLREAIGLASTMSSPQTITFAPGLTGTITLTLGQLLITNSMVIDGPGASLLSISGDQASRLLQIDGNPGCIFVTISGLSIVNGNAGGDGGGGIDVGDTTSGSTTSNVDLTLDSVDVSHNTAFDGGGIDENGLSDDPVYFAATNSTISNNTAESLGGGIYASNASITVANSTIAGNTAENGGGIYAVGTGTLGSAVLTNVTLATNNASTGAGVFGQGSSNPFPLTLENTIATDALAGTAETLLGGNLISGDALLGPLQDNGGPTPTMALLPTSPAIDAGVNSFAVDINDNPLTTDQRGFPRISGAVVDLGAYEVQQISLSPNALANGVNGNAYSQTITSTQPGDQPSWGSTTYAVTSGTPPPGLSLSTGGVLFGTPTAGGTFTFTATASDIAGFGVLAYTVTIAPDGTSLNLTATSAAPVFGQRETFTATVTNTSATATPTSGDGMVTFSDGTTPLGSATLSGSPATATLSTSALASGSHTITASYSGDANFVASGSAGVAVTVSPAPTSIGVSFASSTLGFGQTETLTASITTPAGDGTPTSGDGTVTFYDGTTVLGSATLSGSPAYATLTPASLALGKHIITASYSGDANFVASQSGPARLQLVVPATGLKDPSGVAMDSMGDAFIADFGNSRVVEVQADGTQTAVGSGLSFPTGVAVDGSGDVFIADVGNHRVVEVEADGTQTNIGSGLSDPTGVAVDALGDVFIADSGNNRVAEVNAVGVQTTVGSALSGPTGVAVDSAGDVFVADPNQNQVVELRSAVPLIIGPAPTSISVSASLTSLMFGHAETLTATVTTPAGAATPTSSDGTVTFYDGTTVLGTATLSGSPATATLTPAPLAVGSHTITASYSGDSHFAASSSGVESASVQSVVPAMGLKDPHGVAVDASGDVFIADTLNSQVVEVKADGTRTTVGSGLNEPVGVAVDASGDVFIADAFKTSVVEVKADGTQTTIGSGLSQPAGVAVDSTGEVFIADYGNSREVEVKADGTQTTIGSGLDLPFGVTADGSGDVFVTEMGTRQVVELKADGTQTTIGSGLLQPAGVAVDGSGDVFITDFGNNQVVEVKADGTHTIVDSGLLAPEGVAVDGSGDVFIADTDHDRIVKMTAGPPVTVTPAITSATFLTSDTTTRGNWISAYGTLGYNDLGSAVSNPTGATVTPAGQTLYTWATPSFSTTQALQVPPAGTSRIAAAWYSSTSFTIDVNVATGYSYNLELYFLDYDARGRAETVTLSTASTDTTLNSQSISNFASGEYLIWTISGNVLITITRTAGVNAVLSGLFFTGDAAPVILSTAAVSAAGASGGTGNGSSVQERVATTQIGVLSPAEQESPSPATSLAALDAVLSSGPIASLNDEAGTDHSHNGSVTTFPQASNVPALSD